MINDSVFGYVSIQFWINLLDPIAPLSIFYCIVVVAQHLLQTSNIYRLPWPLEIWIIAESAFHLFVYLRYKRTLQRDAEHPPATSREDRKHLFTQCTSTITDPDRYLQLWFLNAPLYEIKRDNLKEFYLWAFFNRGGPPGQDDDELDEYVAATEALIGRSIENGRGSATCLRLTLDEVKMRHRSILWYSCVGFVDFLTAVKLYLLGFHLHRNSVSGFFNLFPFRPLALLSKKRSPAEHLTYWHRPHTSTTKLPVVFIHGIGIGLYPYTNLLAELNQGVAADEQVGVIAIEIMPVSFRITHPVPGKDQMCNEIRTIIEGHGWDKFVLVSHSYGTIVTTHILKDPLLAKSVDSVVFIDPISFMLHLPDVAYNFTKRKPKRAPEHQLYFFASMDMSVSHALSRCFFWSENILWKEECGNRRVTVSLAERDIIVNTQAVGSYLASSSAIQTRKYQDVESVISERACNGKDPTIPSEDFRKLNDTSINGDTHVTEKTEEIQRTDDWKSQPWRGSGLDIIWHQKLDHAQVFDTRRKRGTLVHTIRSYCVPEITSLLS